jgi:hypothetical protein
MDHANLYNPCVPATCLASVPVCCCPCYAAILHAAEHSPAKPGAEGTLTCPRPSHARPPQADGQHAAASAHNAATPRRLPVLHHASERRRRRRSPRQRAAAGAPHHWQEPNRAAATPGPRRRPPAALAAGGAPRAGGAQRARGRGRAASGGRSRHRRRRAHARPVPQVPCKAHGWPQAESPVRGLQRAPRPSTCMLPSPAFMGSHMRARSSPPRLPVRSAVVHVPHCGPGAATTILPIPSPRFCCPGLHTYMTPPMRPRCPFRRSPPPLERAQVPHHRPTVCPQPPQRAPARPPCPRLRSAQFCRSHLFAQSTARSVRRIAEGSKTRAVCLRERERGTRTASLACSTPLAAP